MNITKKFFFFPFFKALHIISFALLVSSADYHYQYTIDANGLHFGAQEETDGYSTTGQYHVLLPNGRIQTVNYRVTDDNSGFVANVQYSSIANYAKQKRPQYPKSMNDKPSAVHHRPVALDAVAISAAKSAARFFPKKNLVKNT